ncbi:transporter substrate-binding domain-containing protein [Paenibacillus agricola]|uniref:Transporter substrate-binding domain-containing protein n=1 Tax=Paenibacillus agricola TaxID=2716264 RepID=A0ABX0JBG1_9BACL|nr:transporter substrate-binding domain-containing protein [Paenibacillus agricola]NHN32217.1 transporter substrate-binding domain-containing protein [Paenibacillus agricola]
MKKKMYAITLFIIVAAITLVGCSSNKDSNSSAGPASTAASSESSSLAGKKFIIATDATYAPFEYEENGKFVGIDIDLIAAIAKLEGFEYELKPMDFKGIIPAITSNQIDAAIAGMTITDERRNALDFSEGYFESGTSAIVNINNKAIQSPEDFKGKTFAVKKGTVGAKYAEEHKETYNATIKYFDDTPSSFQEVSINNADVTFEDYPVIAYMLSVNKDAKLKIAIPKLAIENYGFAVNKGKNKELLTAFNSGLNKLKQNGEYDKILAKYLGTSK